MYNNVNKYLLTKPLEWMLMNGGELHEKHLRTKVKWQEQNQNYLHNYRNTACTYIIYRKAPALDGSKIYDFFSPPFWLAFYHYCFWGKTHYTLKDPCCTSIKAGDLDKGISWDATLLQIEDLWLYKDLHLHSVLWGCSHLSKHGGWAQVHSNPLGSTQCIQVPPRSKTRWPGE